MSVLRSIESKLESLFEGVFGRAFRTNVQPVELARKLVKEMDDHRNVSVSRVYVPNEYTIYLAPDDRAQFASYEEQLQGELSEFTEANLRAQYAWLKAASGVTPVTNKNHYTRWEGRLQFFEWCERLGLRAEQSRGPSKLGCTGFPFGAAHPYFPARNDGSRNDVLEIGF